MTDEKEIAVSVEYAQNTAASLFGDEAVEPTVEAIKEGEPRDESPPDEEGSVVSEEEQAVEAEADAQGDLKVVVSVRRGRATIGVQRPSSDPHIESFDEPDLSGLAHRMTRCAGKGESQVGRLTEEPRLRPAYDFDRASAPAQRGFGAGSDFRGSGSSATGAQAVLAACALALRGPRWTDEGGWPSPKMAACPYQRMHICGSSCI